MSGQTNHRESGWTTRARYLMIALFIGCLSSAVAAPEVAAQEEQEQTEWQYLPDGTPVPAAAAEPPAESVTTEVNEAGQEPPGWIDYFLRPHYLAFLVLILVGLILLLRGWLTLPVRIAMLAVAFVLFGLDLIFPLHPSPMCATTKLFMFKITHGSFFPHFVALFLVMMIPSLIGRKLFCGWVCPLGALQDLINKISFPIRVRKFSFVAFNGVRLSLLGLFILTTFAIRDHVAALAQGVGANADEGLWAGFSAYSVYEPINFFELLHWNMTGTFIVMFVILAGASLLLYRPFCYSICPIGALTWILERIAPGRIRIDQSKCSGCGICSKASPCPTIDPLLEGKSLVPDCTSCGECIRTCPTGAIGFRFWGQSSR